MEKNELRTNVRAMVDDLFNEKEESKIRKKTEATLEKSATTISNLTSTLEDKNIEVAAFETKLSESAEATKILEKELEAAREELETSKSLLKDKEAALEDVIKVKVAGERMSELETSGVARAEKKIQLAKIKDMSDEEFASYKEELTCVKVAVEAALIKANEELQESKAKEDAKKAEEEIKKAAEKKAKEEGSTDNKEIVTIPAKINNSQAAMASLNMEYVPDNDFMAKYAKLGEAIAADWKKE